jgi:glycosyltransferase involved in cell wall biosynthesis
MKVAYDISILGQGYVNPKARTGLFRAIESLLLALLTRNDLDLQTIALNQNGSIWENTSSELYLQNVYPQLSSHFQSCYSSHLYLNSLYTQAVRLQRSLIQFSAKKQILIYKFAQALKIPFDCLESFDIKLSFEPNSCQLYHSSYFPLPSQNLIGNIPRVLTIHDIIPILYPNFATTKVCHRFIKTIESLDREKDYIICNSEHTKIDVCNYLSINQERVFVTYFAAANHFSPITELDLISQTIKRYGISSSPYILSLCTLEPRKNLSFLIRCFSEVIDSNPSLDINLVLVGVSGWKNSDIFKSANENLKLQSRIIFTGYIPDEDLSAIYSGAIAFVYPSLYEGFGLPPLEAMQCGTPVITSNISSLPEVVGNAGITIDPTQEDDLCEALLRVVNDSTLRESLSQAGIQRATQFSWEKCAEETVNVYRAAVDQ